MCSLWTTKTRDAFLGQQYHVHHAIYSPTIITALEHFRNVERENFPADLFRCGDECIVYNLFFFGSRRSSEHIRTGIPEIALVSEIEPRPQDTSLSTEGSNSEIIKNNSLQIRVRRPAMLALEVEVLVARCTVRTETELNSEVFNNGNSSNVFMFLRNTVASSVNITQQRPSSRVLRRSIHSSTKRGTVKTMNAMERRITISIKRVSVKM